MSRISTSQKPSPMNSQLFCGKKTTNFGFGVGGGAGRGDKRHSQATFPKSTEFQDSWPFLSFLLPLEAENLRIRRFTSTFHASVSLFLSLAHARTRTPPPHALPSPVYFVSFLKDSEVSQVQQKQVTILDSFRFSFFSFFSRPHPRLSSFFFLLLFFSFLFFWFFFFGRV